MESVLRIITAFFCSEAFSSMTKQFTTGHGFACGGDACRGTYVPFAVACLYSRIGMFEQSNLFLRTCTRCCACRTCNPRTRTFVLCLTLCCNGFRLCGKGLRFVYTRMNGDVRWSFCVAKNLTACLTRAVKVMTLW